MSKTFYLVVSIDQLSELLEEAKRSSTVMRNEPEWAGCHCVSIRLEEKPGYTADDGAGSAYAFNGGRDAKAVANLLAQSKASPDALLTVATLAWKETGYPFTSAVGAPVA